MRRPSRRWPTTRRACWRAWHASPSTAIAGCAGGLARMLREPVRAGAGQPAHAGPARRRAAPHQPAAPGRVPARSVAGARHARGAVALVAPAARAGHAEDATQLRLESDRNLVQIVTIHKAKGLEYPIVFCPFLWDGHPGPAGDLDRAGIPRRRRQAGDRLPRRRRPRRQAEDGAGARRREPAPDLRGADAGGAPLLPGGRLVHGGAIQLDQGMHARPHQLAGRGARARSEPMARQQPRRRPDRRGLGPPGAGERARHRHRRIAAGPGPAGDPAERPSPEKLAAREPPLFIPPAWRIGSYSSLAHGARSENAAADHDVRVPRERCRAGRRTQQALAADDILRFPRGARAGECLHAVFEQVDFTDATGWPQVIAKVLRTQPPQAATRRQRILAGHGATHAGRRDGHAAAGRASPQRHLARQPAGGAGVQPAVGRARRGATGGHAAPSRL